MNGVTITVDTPQRPKSGALRLAKCVIMYPKKVTTKYKENTLNITLALFIDNISILIDFIAVKHFQPADTALHLLDFIHAEEIDEEHEIPEGEDPLMKAIETGHEYEGDIVLTAKEAEVIVNGTKEDKISMRTEIHEKHWPKHNSLIYIPYVISDVYNKKERGHIARAVKDYQDNTCIR